MTSHYIAYATHMHLQMLKCAGASVCGYSCPGTTRCCHLRIQIWSFTLGLSPRPCCLQRTATIAFHLQISQATELRNCWFVPRCASTNLFLICNMAPYDILWWCPIAWTAMFHGLGVDCCWRLNSHHTWWQANSGQCRGKYSQALSNKSLVCTWPKASAKRHRSAWARLPFCLTV